MLWAKIRQAYPNQWLIVEALEAHTTKENLRQQDRLSVLETCNSGVEAMQIYRRLHKQYPNREFYFVHTNREKLNIHEIQWYGIRSSHAVDF
jgi:hypothetical protein